jgi:NAD(P)-dependent dehydrogenase (short-subunit alcohol dehydrogenase family)
MQETVLITGANRGIGLEFVRQFARGGSQVIACCREPTSASALNTLMQESDGKVTVHRLDVANRAQREDLRRELGDTPIDLLINNAGVYGQRDATFGNIDEQQWLETFAINAIAPIKLSEALVENVARGRRKIIASISSQMGSIADNSSGGHYVYRSSKAALNAAMKSMALDLQSRGVIAAILHPGWVKTDLGGPNALISVEESVDYMRATLERVTLKDSGTFFDIDGSVMPW